LLASATPAQPTAGATTPRDLAALLPAETVLVVECADVRATVAGLYAALAPLPPAAQALGVLWQVGLLAECGTDLDGVLGVLAPGAALLGLVPVASGGPRAVVLARIDDAAAVRRLAARLPRLGIELHGGVCALFPRAADAAVWRAFVASARPRLVHRADFRRDAPELGPGLVRLWVDLAALRRASPRASFDRLDPGGRVLLGPLAAALDRAHRLDAVLRLQDGAIRLMARADGSAFGSPAGLLLARPGAPRRPPKAPAGTIAAVYLDRSLRAYLQHAERLLPAATAARVRGEAANLDQLAGGVSFVDDVLGGLEEPWSFLVVSPEPAVDDVDANPRPRVVLPGFALVARLTDERAAARATRAFYRLSAVLSAQRLQRRLPPRLAQPRTANGLRLHVMRGWPYAGAGEPPTGEQIEATLLCTAGHIVVASTPACALAVARALGEPDRAVVGDAVRLDPAALADVLRRNRSGLVLARVLDEGESQAQAGTFVDGLCAALELLGAIELDVQPGAEATTLCLTVTERAR